MPIYEYVCEECRKTFEKILLNRAEAVACPACGSTRYALQFSVVAAPRKAANGESADPTSCACTPTTCGCN